MEISHLRYFHHVARSGSFARAAKLAHVSAPAMTKAIQKLEAETGVRLFERTTRRVTLTEEGRVLFQRASEILSRVDDITRDLDELRQTVAGELRVAAMEVFSVRVLPRAVSRLVAQYPKLVPLIYEMHPESMQRHLAEGEIDVGYTIGASSGERVDSDLFGVSPGRIVCGRSHPLYAKKRITRADLARYPFAVPRFFQRESLPSLDQFPETKHPRQVGATIELLQTMVELALAGSYLGYFPEISIAHHLRTDELRVLRGLRGLPKFELCVLTRRGAQPRRAVTLLTAEIRQVLRDQGQF